MSQVLPEACRPYPVWSAWVPPTRAQCPKELFLSAPGAGSVGGEPQEGLNVLPSGQRRPGGPRASPGPPSGVEASPHFHSPSEHCGPSWEPPLLSCPQVSDAPPRSPHPMPSSAPATWPHASGSGLGTPKVTCLSVAAGMRRAQGCRRGDSEGQPCHLHRSCR